MSIHPKDQLSLLHDLLDEHGSHEDGAVSEYEQIKRLVKELMGKNRVSNEELLNALPEIYNYGRQGVNAQNSPEHIHKNKMNIEYWKQLVIDSETLE